MYLGTFSNLSGSYKTIGLQESAELKMIPGIETILFGDSTYDSVKTQEAIKCLETYYPELLEELEEIAGGYNRPISELRFIQDSYLSGGGCSLGALKPSDNNEDKMYLFRTYDMDPNISEMRLCSTKSSDSYSHTGFSSSFFGRSDGMNEHGLCVMFASCGMPVGHYPGMKEAKVPGLNFMVIVRLFLEKCKTIQEVIDLFLKVPIASNVNLLVADASNEVVILETLDGLKDYSIVSDNHAFVTNHASLEKIKKQEKFALSQSKIREKKMYQFFDDAQKNSKESIYRLMNTEYPNGITSLNYQESFGTVYSVIYDVTDKVISYSFGSPMYNDIYTIKLGDIAEHGVVPVNLPSRSYGKEFWHVELNN